MEFLKKLRILNSNALKLIAAVSMFIDHLGLIFFPNVMALRLIGRLAMPIFAFAIAEGCRYTRNKFKHFAIIFTVGVLCQIVYCIFDPENLYFGILITFSFSIVTIYALQFAKKLLFDRKAKLWTKIGSWLLFFAAVAGTYAFCRFFTVDYGFFGCMMPVFASIFDFRQIPAPDKIQKIDCLPLRVGCMAIPLFLLMITHSIPQFVAFSFLAFPLLFLYNGEKGKVNLKYFFYIFYPAHLGILEGIQILSYLLK